MLRESRTWLRLVALAPLATAPVMRPSFSLQNSWPVLILSIAFAGCSSVVASGPEADARKAAQERYAKAKALFEERCKTAGVVIKRTVKDVEGIELTKIRQPIPWAGKEYFDPMYPEAAMAGEYRGDDYIKQFLMTEIRDRLNPEQRGMLTSDNGPNCERCLPVILGYRFVEYRDSASDKLFRASFPGGAALADWRLDFRRDEVGISRTRYALDYEDLVNPADRALWIAGSRLKVIDKQTGDVIAELTRYVWDSGFGVSTTGRWPWAHANATGRSQTCPAEVGVRHQISRFFIDSIVQPNQGK
ncbi:hypothetical protein [Roseateles sp. BYS96W]|uniref:DUF1329 domain-containing protein n=1 Tax=Pelomonas nitida TaxID=3299027 RepID=A0ABW7G655_9BURK